MIITIGSLKGSPGATTLAALLGDAWPSNQTEDSDPVPNVLLEADPEGGVLGARWLESLGVSWTPGIVEVSSQCRSGRSMIQAVQNLTQPVTPTLGVVPGLPSRAAMSSAVKGLADTSIAELARWDRLVLVDVGRYSPITYPLLARSQLSLIIAEPTLEAAQLLQTVVPDITKAGGKVGLITIGDSPYSPAELAAAVHVEPNLVWSVPVDARASRAVNAGGPQARGVKRSRLGRAVGDIAVDIASKTQPITVSTGGVGEPDRKVRDAMVPTEVSSASFGEVTSRG